MNTTIEPFLLIGIAIRTTNENGKAAKDIPQLWDKLMGENIIEQIPNKLDTDICAVYTDYEGDHNKPYTTILGCRVSSHEDVPSGMVARSFEGGTHKTFIAKGNLGQNTVINKWMEIWQSDMSRTYTADFEIYGERAQNPEDAEVDIHIAI